MVSSLAATVQTLVQRVSTRAVSTTSATPVPSLLSSERAQGEVTLVPVSPNSSNAQAKKTWAEIAKVTSVAEAESQRKAFIQEKLLSCPEHKREGLRLFFESKSKFSDPIVSRRGSPIDRTPSQATSAAQAELKMRHVYVSGFKFEPLRSVKTTMQGLRISTSKIPNMRWIGTTILDCLVDDTYEKVFIAQLQEIDPSMIIKFDATGANLVNVEKKKVAGERFHKAASLAIEKSSKPRVKEYFSKLLEEMGLEPLPVSTPAQESASTDSPSAATGDMANENILASNTPTESMDEDRGNSLFSSAARKRARSLDPPRSVSPLMNGSDTSEAAAEAEPNSS